MILFFALALSLLLGSTPVAAQSSLSSPTASRPDGLDSPLEKLVRRGDRRFNTADYGGAIEDYRKALLQARKSRLAREECELLNNMAATFMAQNNLEDFHRAFAQTRECKWGLEKVRKAQVARPGPGNLLVNGGFEAGLVHPWGTGHYETVQGKSHFGIWWNSMNARAFMKLDSDQRHSGRRSLRITNYSPPQPHVFTTTSQRLKGLKPNTVYRLSLYAKADNLKGGAFFTVDAAWTKRFLTLLPGTYGWTHFSGSVNIGHNDYIDVRLILGDPGTLWVDELVVEVEQDPTGLQALLQKAESLYDQAQFREALARCQELARSHADNRGGLMQVRHLEGRIHLSLGHYEDARRHFQWLANSGFRPAPIALGDLFYQLGEFDRANEEYHKALELYKGDQGTYSRIQEKLAANLLAQGQWDQALKAQRLSLQIQRHIGDLHGQALALNTTGLLFLQKQSYEQALEPLAMAVTLSRQVQDPRLLAVALINQGEALLRLGRLTAAGPLAEEGLHLAQTMENPRPRLQALYLRGRLFRLKGDAVKALADLREAVKLLQELYAHLGVTPRETRQAFLSQFADLYRDYIDLLLEQYQQSPRPELREEAFQRSEEARARLFTEMVNEVRAAQAFTVATQDPALPQLLMKEREARLQLEGVRRQQAQLLELPAAQRQPAQQAALDRELARALETLSQIQKEVSQRHPRYADLKHPQPLTFKEVQGLLQADEALLSFFVTSRHTAVWAVNREGVKLAVLPLGLKALRERIRHFTETLPSLADALEKYNQHVDNPQAARELQEKFASFDLNAAHSLYQALVGPVAGILTGKRLVFLAPDDLLYQMPFEALLTGPAPATGGDLGQPNQMNHAPFWVRNQCLSYLPSVSVLRSLRTLGKDNPATQKPLVAFADPIFENGNGPSASTRSRQARLQSLRSGAALRAGRLPRLPETADEARRAAQVLGGREEDLYLQQRASEYHLKKLPLAGYRVLLFATHGLMAGEFRLGVQPALALSFVGDPKNDGLLEMSEILGLDLKARLVVLSACNTGRSSAPEDKGEGFAGLTRSFMYAGAESVVVTLWSVESESAVQLMGNFYSALQHKNKAIALADAKRAMITGGGSLPLGQSFKLPLSHPFFWAPYVLVGDAK